MSDCLLACLKGSRVVVNIDRLMWSGKGVGSMDGCEVKKRVKWKERKEERK